MDSNSNTRTRIGIGEFVRNAIALPDDEFEQAMRLDNTDEDINNIKIVSCSIDAYERS